ncbi:hypothetical protein [Spiroplasma floricola]|uniref:Uncharacterized protein n=1 Tax=Spiroplasma floricola 23-6 TaxID=1336749 RepID=A0A2K8SEM1_9MOLU|nr:hypothetical protein [Spiroplasma floricola]AUB31891.1 hypothetical protein SFLOR_v1c08430 [Spiroplasma floricola 23-6]
MLIEQITKRFKKKFIETKIEDIKFKWEFEDFFNVLNINNFFTMMQKQLKVEYNFNQEKDIREKVENIRNLLLTIFDQAKEININLSDLNKLDNLIHMTYMEVKEIINNGLIVYLFYEKIHCSIEYKNNYYDTDQYFLLKISNFEKKLNTHLNTFLKFF